MKYKKNNLALYTAAVSFCYLSASAIADDSKLENVKKNEDVERIIVKGFSKSLDKSLSLKKTAVGVRDSIVSEDIGKFPDLNLAESLQRVTGVAISRDSGEGQQITVRGLAPEFTRVQLNGMSISSAADGGTGQGSVGREFDFDIFLSDMFRQIDIDKTSRASLEEGGLAASVNMQAPRPFDFNGPQLSASGQVGYSELPDASYPRLHFLASNTFADESFGVLFQAGYSERDVRVEGTESIDWTTPNLSNLDVNFPADSNVLLGDQTAVENALFPRLPRTELQINTRQRLNIGGAIQWFPSDDVEVVFEGLYAKLERTSDRHNLDVVFRNQKDIEVIDANVVNGAIQSGTFRNLERRSENKIVEDETDVLQLSLSGKWNIAEDFTVSGLVGMAESTFDQPFQTSYMFQVEESEVTMDFSNNSKMPSITTDVDLTDPNSYASSGLRIRPQLIKDESTTAKLDFEWGDGDSSLKFGFAFNSFQKDKRHFRNDGSAAGTPVSEYGIQMPFDDFLDGLGGKNTGFPTEWIIVDTAKGKELFDTVGLSRDATVSGINSFVIEEETFAGYLSGNFSGTLLGRDIHTNAGVRVVRTDQTASSQASTGDAISVDQHYTDVLPSVNINLEWSEELTARLSMAQTMTRPSLAALSPATEIEVGGGSSGNPTLNPFRANQVDVSLEWYFAPKSLLSLTAFYKNITGFIVSETDTILFSDFGVPLSSLDADEFAGITSDSLFTISRPVNSNDPTTLKGFEFAYQQPLDMITEGLGLLTNFTYADSETDFVSGTIDISGTIPGLSKYSYNVVTYYEVDDYSLRASYNWRDDYIETSSIRDGTGLLRTREAAGFLDLSASYNLTDKITLSFEAVNVLDTKDYTYTGRKDLWNRYVQSGRQFSMGIRGSF